MDYQSVNATAQPNESSGRFSPSVGTFLGQTGSSSGLMNMDANILKQELMGAYFDVKGHAGQKRRSSKNAKPSSMANAIKKSAGSKTSKSRKTSNAKKLSKEASAAKKPSKARKNSAAKKSPKSKKKSASKKRPKNSAEGKADPDSKKQMIK